MTKKPKQLHTEKLVEAPEKSFEGMPFPSQSIRASLTSGIINQAYDKCAKTIGVLVDFKLKNRPKQLKKFKRKKKVKKAANIKRNNTKTVKTKKRGKWKKQA